MTGARAPKTRAARPAPGRRARRKQQTREALLEAALRLFGKHGVYETRVEDVTEDADVGKGAFYNYYPSKAALVADFIARGVNRLSETYLGSERPTRFADRLASVVRAHDRFFSESPSYGIVFHQARGMLELDAGAAPVLRTAFQSYLGRLASFLLPAAPHGTTVAVEVAVAVAGCIAGYRSFGLAAGIPAAPAALTALLVRGVPGLAGPSRVQDAGRDRANSTTARRNSPRSNGLSSTMRAPRRPASR